MALPHGRAISGQELELEVGRTFSVEQFASLCNAIAWCVGRESGIAQLSFTERVNVADNGIDAEWRLELPKEDLYKTAIVGPGWNVFQHKKRDVTAQDRKKTLTELVGNLKGALKHIVDEKHRYPDRYVLFTNVHLTKPDKERFEQSMRKYCDKAETVEILIFGAGEIATFTNNLPHIRSGYFATNNFAIWPSAWNTHNRQKSFGRNVELTGRKEILEELKAAVNDAAIEVIVVSGPHQIGKSRIVFEATRHRQLEAVVALDPLSIDAVDLFALRRDSGEALVIVEDLDSDRAIHLANATIGEQEIKLILTVHTSDPTLGVNFGLDPRLKHMSLQGLSEQDSSALLRLAGAKFDYSVESWVIQQAGGSPGILLLAAQTPDMRSKVESFTDQIARSFEITIRDSYGDKGIQAIRVISLLTHVGFRDHKADEIKTVAEFLGVRLDDVLDSARELEAAGIVRVRGSFLEVSPPLFANYEAVAAIRGKAAQLSKLLLNFAHEGQMRLLRRLRTLHGSEIRAFWEEFFGKDGPFSEFKSALGHASLLHLIVAAVPESVADLLHDGLSRMSHDERLGIQGSVRRDLMWTLDELLFRRKASEKALKSVALLAEAENESFGNNASGVFCECFHPDHPQFPLRLELRLRVLKDAIATSQSEAMNALAIKAMDLAFDRYGAVTLRRSDGPVPLDSRPEIKWGEFWEYYREIARLILRASLSSRTAVSKEARSVLPRVLSELIIHTPPLESTKFCVEVVTRILNREIEVSINDLSTHLGIAKESVDSYEEEHSRKDEARESSQLLGALLTRLDEAGFDTRVKRWIGGHQSGKYEADENGNFVFESDRKIEALAREAVANNGLLTPELLNWLISEEAKQNWLFFYRLGQGDTDRGFLEAIENLARSDQGARPFGAYFGGLSGHSPEFVTDRLDELVHDATIVGRAIVYATHNQPGNSRSVERMRALMHQRRIDLNDVGRLLSTGGWSKDLTLDECYDLLSFVAGPDLENAGAVIDFLAMWVHGKKPLEGKLADLAWRCLEGMPAQVDIYDSDIVAAALVGNDLDRAFRLLESLMNQPYNRKGWQPIDHLGARKFWHALHKADKSRLLRLMFGLDFVGATRALNVSWHLPALINWEEDKEILRAIALENEARANLVLQCASRAGLWPLAIELLERFPDSKRIQRTIISRAEHDQEVIKGSRAAHYKTCAAEVQKVLDDHAIPFAVKAFLEEIQDRFREAATREQRIEEDQDVNW